ncbi:UVI-1 [Ustulina deusta]|nr:UVI-1 [Ustulina deusta]KAI3340929.1 UVI-1 [Ustulina deusta]
MLFSKIFAAGAIMASTAMASLSPSQIADSIKQVTIISQNLQAPANSITLVNAPLIIIGQGPFPQIIAGFTQIVTVVGATITSMDGTQPVSSQADADLIFNAFRGFVRVHQQLLNILIGKSGILTSIPLVGQPVAAVLRQVEGVVDTIAIALIDIAEARAQDLESEANNLGGTLDLAIQKYQGISLNI